MSGCERVIGRCVVTLLLWSSAVASAANHVWIIGGGPTPGASQAQIELNVKWVIDSLRSVDKNAVFHVYFANGKDSGKDIVSWLEQPTGENDLVPLARVFGAEEATHEVFRRHQLPYVIGGTEAVALTKELERGFSALGPGDRMLLIYNGHGLQDEGNGTGHVLRLWNETRLSVRDLERLLGVVHPEVPVRFLFTQCYSGGFLHVIRPGGAREGALASGKRCGFAAESEDRESEGCSPSIKIGEYRDYTTYFFAALSGKSRLGSPVAGDVDRNGDGVLSLHEAHLYVLRDAENADLPRSSSEMYIERWQPWYLRWVDTGSVPDNEYGRMAGELAAKLGLSLGAGSIAGQIKSNRGNLAKGTEALKLEKSRVRERAGVIEKILQKEVLLRWPEAGRPYTRGYVTFLGNEVQDARRFILGHPRYSELVRCQDRLTEIDREIVKLDRAAARLDMVLRLRRLARILEQFQRHASESEKQEYAQLAGCERSYF
jgi:hypothetical protein